jgi:hypothetical protein
MKPPCQPSATGALPDSFSSAAHLISTVANAHNKLVQAFFKDVGDTSWTADISTPRASLRVACTILNDYCMVASYSLTSRVEFPGLYEARAISIWIKSPLVSLWRKAGYLRIEELFEDEFFTVSYQAIDFGKSRITIPA